MGWTIASVAMGAACVWLTWAEHKADAHEREEELREQRRQAQRAQNAREMLAYLEAANRDRLFRDYAEGGWQNAK